MAISFVRIDNRLIHGQIVTAWSKELKCDGIIAIDTEIFNDAILTNVYKSAAPTGVKVWIFDVKNAVEKLPQVIGSNKKYFVICKSPITLMSIMKKGLSLDNENNNIINVGPIHIKEGAKTIGPNVTITEDEKEAFNFLSTKHKIQFKLVPTSKEYYWDEIISENRRY